MKMKTITYILSAFFLLFGWAACSDSEGDIPVPENGETCSLTIQLGAEETEETRVSSDPNANDGEFIHSLWVFITDEDGVIEAKFNYTEGTEVSDVTVVSDEGSTTEGGNVLQWQHTVEGLPLGDKIIYAFANMDEVTEMTDILAKDKGEKMDDVVDNLVISNPAASVDIAYGKYIPMSKKQHEEYISNHRTVFVKLVRLVARVDAMLSNTMTNGTILTPTSFTMKSFANQVALFGGETGATIGDGTVEYEYTFPENITISSGEANAYPFSFYVNETGSKDYDVELTVGSNTYTGRLTLLDEDVEGLPRNYILPLNLTVGDNKLIIEMYLAPIGGYPFAVGVSGDLLNPAETTAVEIPEGCSFRVRDAVDEDKYYDISTESEIIQIDNDKTWAHVTALPGQRATIEANGIEITVTTTPLKDYTRSATVFLHSTLLFP